MDELSKLESERNTQMEVIGNLHDTLSAIRKYAEFERQITGHDYFSSDFITITNIIQNKLYREESSLTGLQKMIAVIKAKTSGLLKK